MRLTQYPCPVEVYASSDELGQALATHIADLISAANRADRPFILGCPAGRSPITTYQALGAAADSEDSI